MTQFEWLYILLGVFTLVLQVISVFHPLLKDIAEYLALRHKESKDICNEQDL